MDDGPGDETQAIPATPEWVLADRYRVLDRIGSGGMADVFRAHDDQLDRDVAVKVFRTPVDEPGNATAVERRELELRALAQLSHPNLIALYDANIVDAHPAFLVTELVIGPNLADRLSAGPLPEQLARTVGEQIADALAYVHARGMVHRDVKPANILLGTDGATPETATIRARLSDFGIVRVLEDARMTAAEFTLGTAFYIAPEQARGADVDAAADVYSLGLVLIEMLTGRRSFDGPMHEAMAARLTRSPDIPSGLPQPWPGLLAAMTQISPTARPSAAQVAQSLRTSSIPALAAGSVPPLPLAARPGPMVAAMPAHLPAAAAVAPEPFDVLPPQRRRGVGLAVAALASLAVIAAAAILMFRPTAHPSSPAGGASDAPTAGSARSSAGSATRSNNDAAVPVTAGKSGGSSAGSGPASTGAPTTSRATSSHASSSPARSSTSAKPSSSTTKPSPSKTKTTSPPPSTPATTGSAPASGSGVPATGGAVTTSAA